MAEKKNIFGKLFGNKAAEKDIDDNTTDNIAEYPDEVNEVIEAPLNTDETDIESEAKNNFNSEYKESIDDKIKSIRENALNTYAKSDDSAEEEINDVTVADTDDEDDDVKEFVGKLDDFNGEEQASDKAEAENTEAAEEQGAKNYDMTQLLKILKTEERSDDDEDSDEADKKKKKSYEFTDETDAVNKFDDEIDAENVYPHDFEYTDALQSQDLFKSFRNSAAVSLLSCILTFLFTVLCIWFECGHGAGLPFSHMLKPGYFGRVYAMVSLQMLAFCVMFNLDGLSRGIKKLSVKKAAPEAVAVVAVAVCAIHTLLSAVFAYGSIEYTTFCFAGCIILLFLSFNNFVKAYTRFKAFGMAISQKSKFTTVKLDALSEESNVFAKYLNEESEVLCVSKTENVKDFVKNTYTVPKALSGCNVLMYITVALGVVTAAVKFFLLDSTGYNALTDGVSVIMFSCPVTLLLSTALPYFITSTRISKLRNAVIGEAACDRFENAGVISFDDTEVFPPKTVKVTSIKTYNNNRIDKVIVCMAKIFEKLGGPLSHVFASSLQGGVGDIGGVMVLESSKDGLHLTVDGEDILVGNADYLRMFDVEAPVDEGDEAETRSLTSILYLVNGGELSAKFYIKYTLNRKFEYVLNGLYDAGVCCGVRTNDPGVDNQVIEAGLKESNYPVSVIQKPLKDIGRTEEASDGTLIGLSGIHGFLRSFIMLDKLRSTYKTNTVFGILAGIIGLAASMILVFAGAGVSQLSIVLFYLFWLIPIFLISFFRK